MSGFLTVKFKIKETCFKKCSAFFYFLSYQPVVDYIDRQFESYLQEELKIKRSLHNYHDSRVHACLYFISPSGHSLKSLDLVTMKKLDSKVDSSNVLSVSEKKAVFFVPKPGSFNKWNIKMKVG